jgi:hypothetical protein
MKAAASRRNIAIEFRRTSGDLIRFKIIEPNSSTPDPVAPPAVSPETPAKRKGGRPKKSA